MLKKKLKAYRLYLEHLDNSIVEKEKELTDTWGKRGHGAYACRLRGEIASLNKSKEIYKEIFGPFLLTDEILELNGLTLEYFAYGDYQLKDESDFGLVTEGEFETCIKRAYEIINK